LLLRADLLCRRVGFIALAVLLGGCSIKRMAVNKLGDALAGGGTSFSSDDDPELVKAAVPFSLKLIESLLAESPKHEGLLLAAASGFTQYGYAFVNQDADEKEDSDLAAATAMRARARRLYLRARGYGLRGLELRHPGISEALRKQPKSAVKTVGAKEVPFLYWTAAAWGAAISVSKDDPALVSDQIIVEALIDRALELDEDFDQGAIHAFLIHYEMARQGLPGDPSVRARKHFDRAMELSGGRLASPLVTLAEAVAVEKQDRKEFESLLQRALAINADAVPEFRLLNLVAQRRARWLLGRVDDLFIGGAKSDDK
jgi:predicted anti-sigma-YlaC factor YlaD